MLLLPLGIGPRQARVLDALSRMGEVSQVTLAKEFGITQASMSTMTNRLMASGHVVRRDDPADTRGKLLSLSDGGHAMLERAYQAWNELDQHASDAIGADAYKALTSGAGTCAMHLAAMHLAHYRKMQSTLSRLGQTLRRRHASTGSDTFDLGASLTPRLCPISTEDAERYPRTERPENSLYYS